MSTPGTTLAFLGCGTLGTAILSGVLDAVSSQPSSTLPRNVPTSFTACVKSVESAKRVRDAVASLKLASAVTVYTSNNVAGVKDADMVLLGCKPYMCSGLLMAPGMSEALSGKLLVSICAGVKISQLKEMVPSSTRVVRVMPNTAAKIRESMTVISAEETIAEEEKALVKWIFEKIGKALVLDEKHMDVATALCGSGPAFYALIVEAMADGGVMMGVPRKEAVEMAAQTMQGTGRMILAGQHPAIIREQVSTPAGCTIAGLLKMEDGKVRSVVARAIEEATNVASGLGGKK
ncbi:pyrroline-5-carboxylate reductase dimerization-domain-containing protein [Sphaerosporella brunnea]|uniref:Pyrroline-5-carboxylate reductase n=1 Tax=Sphaerosporella brunnea TaxID=1250544 RepID=A0A5J5ERI1_9PEZI|nr:pyrroline-5-carboxylate reductase dimerization-domain-containing protein [Sphaerosporella brunnea]